MQQHRFFKGAAIAAWLAAAAMAVHAEASPGTPSVGSGEREGASDRHEAVFAAADQNGDGYLSAEEFIKLPNIVRALRQRAAFERLDADADGWLTAEEFAAARGGRGADGFRDGPPRHRWH